MMQRIRDDSHKKCWVLSLGSGLRRMFRFIISNNLLCLPAEAEERSDVKAITFYIL